MHGAGRSERARIAERVRAVLVDAGHPPAAPPESSVRDLSDDVAVGQPSLLQRLAARRPVRVDPGRRGAMAVGVAALVAAVLTGWWVWSARPHSVPLGDHSPVAAPSDSVPALSRSPGPAPVVTSTSASPPAVVVDVEGKVRRPGLYRLPAGARVADAIRAAGGVRTGVETTRLNLAARVTDGQQIAVGVAGATAGDVPAGASGGSGDGASTDPTAPVDLNTATLDQLETLPGVGPVLGQHILDWRAAHGSFASIAQLDDVPGIGPAKFGELKGLVTV